MIWGADWAQASCSGCSVQNQELSSQPICRAWALTRLKFNNYMDEWHHSTIEYYVSYKKHPVWVDYMRQEWIFVQIGLAGQTSEPETENGNAECSCVLYRF